MLGSPLKWSVFMVAFVMVTMISVSCQKSADQIRSDPYDSRVVLPESGLLMHTGQPFQWHQDMTADVALVFFGYTHCPDVCPMTLAILQAMLADIPPHHRERIQVILISVDPERDGPAELANYLSFFDDSFMGLTGEIAAIQTIIDTLGATAKKEADTSVNNHYLVSHTARLYMVKADGQVSTSYPFGFSAENVRQDLIYLLDQTE